MGLVDEDQPLAEAAPEPPPEIGIEDIQMLLLGVPERVSDLVFALTDAQLGYRHGPAFPTAGEVAELVAHGSPAGIGKR